MSIDKTPADMQEEHPEEMADRLHKTDVAAEMEETIIHLKELLAERTAALEHANSILQKELSEKKLLEEELLRSKKLESVGMLAGGVAHDFNNLLTAISGNVSLAKMYISANDKAYGLLEKVEQISVRASDLTRQLVTFSRGGDPVRKPAVIGDLIKKATLFSLSGSNVRCEFNIAQDLSPVLCDEGQIRQVIHNIVLNARDAMPDGGVLTVSAANTNITGNIDLPLPEGDYIAITITDHGVGIPEHNLLRIFDPYFTTKDAWHQKGLGLGLSICHSIIRTHKGHIAVRSIPDEGTTFVIYLPHAKIKSPAAEISSDIPQKGRARVLIMDDEDSVRTIAVEMLRHIGCDVESARDGAEAIELFTAARKAGKPFDVVILDLTVAGGMGGKETIKRLIEIDPKVKAIVSSGYSSNRIMSDYTLYGFRAIMPKPFNISDLAKSVFSLKNTGG